jgi:hypothetical protein
MALPPDAPERAQAEAHARTCASCTRALEEGRRLLTLIEAAPPPAPSAAALERASTAILSDLDEGTAARDWALRLTGAVVAAVLAAWALPLALMRAPVAAGAPLALSFGLAALAALASAATVRWGGRVAAAFPALSVAWALLAGTGGALAPVVGLHCASIEAMTAAGVGGAAWLAGRVVGRSALRRQLVVAAAGGGALAGHATLHLGCSAATELPHLLVFHAGPVMLAVGAAFAIAAAATRRASAPGIA